MTRTRAEPDAEVSSDDDPTRPNSGHSRSALPLTTALVVALAVAAAWPLAHLLLPDAHVPRDAQDLSYDPTLVLREPADRVPFVVGLLLTALGVGLALRRREPLTDRSRRRAERALPVLAVLLGPLLALEWLRDDTRLPLPAFRGFRVLDLLVGGALLAGYALLTRRGAVRARDGALVALGVWAASSSLQLPGGFAEPGHAPFVGDELLGPAAGRGLFGDYVPQYATLLGEPLRLLSFDTPDEARRASAVLLSVLLVSLPCLVWCSVRRLAPAHQALLPVAFAVAVAQTHGGTGLRLSANSYPPTAVRYVGPLVLLAVLLWCQRRLRDGWRADVVVGLLAGVVALDNADFGVPAAAAAVLVRLLATREGRARCAGRTVAGASVPFALACLVTGLAPTAMVRGWLFFPLQFGARGFFNVPAPVLGPWAVTATLAAALAVLAAARLERADDERQRSIACACLFVAVWTAGSLSYVTGRSYAQVFFVGHAGQTVLVAGLGLLLLRPLLPPLEPGALRLPLPLVTGPVLLAACFGLVVATLLGGGTRLPSPYTTQAALRAPATALPEPPGSPADAVLAPWGNAYAASSGRRNAAVFNSPVSVVLGPVTLRRQCQALAAAGTGSAQVLDIAGPNLFTGQSPLAETDRVLFRLLQRDPRCRALLDVQAGPSAEGWYRLSWTAR